MSTIATVRKSYPGQAARLHCVADYFTVEILLSDGRQLLFHRVPARTGEQAAQARAVQARHRGRGAACTSWHAWPEVLVYSVNISEEIEAPQ